MGFRLTDDNGMIEFFGLNAGLRPALGALALAGAAFGRFRISAIVTIFVCLAGTAVGRVVGMLQGAEPGLYTYGALGFEIAGALLATLAYGAEKREATLRARAADTRVKAQSVLHHRRRQVSNERRGASEPRQVQGATRHSLCSVGPDVGPTVPSHRILRELCRTKQPFRRQAMEAPFAVQAYSVPAHATHALRCPARGVQFLQRV